MKGFIAVASAVAALCLLSPIASAQMPGMKGMGAPGGAGRIWHVGFGGGASVPVSDAKDAFKNGVHGQGWVSLAPHLLPISVRATFGYEKLDIKAASGVGGTYSGTPTGTVLSGLGNITYGFPLGPVKPYLLAGVGAFNLEADDGAGGSTSKTQFGINGGVGVELKLGQISAYLEGRMENIYTDKGLNAALGNPTDFKTQIIPVTFGISY